MWKYMTFLSTPLWRLPARRASATFSARSREAPSFIGLDRTPWANCRGAPTTPQTEFWNCRDSTRFMTTVPTASMPSSLERLDSKYMARARHSRLVPENVRASETVPREALQAPSVSVTSSKAKPIEIFAKLRSFMPLYPMPELPDATDVRTITVASGSSINCRVFFCGNMTRKLPKSYQNFNEPKGCRDRQPQVRTGKN
ncbi:hypothetical protein CHELA40_10985 [Chelatococcus asaccharovorans]|nr:hypothetical protein CHELA40_10985 [Chelatococcus asaccharovorans]